MRSVTGLCIVMGSALGGFAPSLWGGSGSLARRSAHDGAGRSGRPVGRSETPGV